MGVPKIGTKNQNSQPRLEEYGPKIVYIKGIHNTTADAISRLEYDPSVNQTAESYFMTIVKSSHKDKTVWQSQNSGVIWKYTPTNMKI
jgi:hypothetical protein